MPRVDLDTDRRFIPGYTNWKRPLLLSVVIVTFGGFHFPKNPFSDWICAHHRAAPDCVATFAFDAA